MSNWIEFAKLTGTGAGVAAIVTTALHILADRRKKNAEVGKIDATVQVSMAGAATDMIENLRTEVLRLTALNTTLMERVMKLESEMLETRERCRHLEFENDRLKREMGES